MNELCGLISAEGEETCITKGALFLVVESKSLV